MEKYIDKEYYGILLNDRVPKLDKKNVYYKKVKVSFCGKAYLLEENDEGEIERNEIENDYELKYERDYNIEFINSKSEVYLIEVRLETSYLFLIILLFILGVVIGLLLCRLNPKATSPLANITDYINLSVLGLNIDNDENETTQELIKVPQYTFDITNIKRTNWIINNKEINKQYDFDATFKNITSDEISLANTISAKALAKGKIAPGVHGSFAINVITKNSTTDMQYNIKFQDVTNEKPSHMTFRVRGYDEEFSNLQDLQENLKGIIEQKSEKTFVIDWNWDYETGENISTIKESDLIDTNEAKNLNSYKFKIVVFGEEAI